MSTTPNDRARAVISKAGEGEAIWFLNSRMTVKASGESTNGAFGLTEAVVPPGFSPPLHVHRREEECFYIIEGEMTIQCGGETTSAGAGSFVRLPRDVPHTFLVEGDTPVRMLNFMTPGGGEGFFVAAGRPAETDGLPPAGPVDIERLRQAGALYGSDVVGPPLAAASK
jgi:mannose-6-phosphate isomerase-like protein (cupin superfamily)